MIRVHHGKTRLWSIGGVDPTGVEALTAAARVSDPTAIVWRGDPALPPSEQAVRILGTPLGHPDFLRAELGLLSVGHDDLMTKTAHVQNLQCAWLLLWRFSQGELLFASGSPRSVFHFRCTPRCFVAFSERPPRDRPQFLVLEHSQFASVFGRTRSPQRCLVGPSSLLTKLGGLLVQQRHPAVCLQVLRGFHDQNPGYHLGGLRDSVEFLKCSWFSDTVVGGFGSRCTSSVGPMGRSGNQANRDTVGSTLPLHLCMVTFSQPCGPGCLPLRKHFSVLKVASLMASLSCAFPRHRSRLFSVPRPPPAMCMASPSPLFSLTGQFSLRRVLSRRAFALESAAARVCRETGARVTTNVMVRDLDFVPQDRVDAVPLFHGAQLALTAEAGRRTATAQPSCGWSGSVACPPTERVPGLSCWLGRWSSETQLPPPTCQGEDAHSHERKIGVVAQMEHDLGEEQRSGFVVVSVGGSFWRWERWPHRWSWRPGTLASCLRFLSTV